MPEQYPTSRNNLGIVGEAIIEARRFSVSGFRWSAVRPASPTLRGSPWRPCGLNLRSPPEQSWRDKIVIGAFHRLAGRRIEPLERRITPFAKPTRSALYSEFAG